MKKGLLSLLAAALTIVSCQNYDDQFAELTGLVTTLSNEVSGLSQVQSDLGSVKATVDGLVTAISAIPGSDGTANLTAILEGLQGAQDDIDAIELILANGVASESDLAEIDALIDNVQEGVNTLLTNNQSISVNISIVDTESLTTAQGYIEIGENTPAGYLLGGNLLIDHEALTPAEIETANLMSAKLISVTGTVSVTGAVNLTGLTYIQGAYTKSGAVAPLDSSISSLGSTLKVDGQLGAINFPNLASVIGEVTITNVPSVTSIDFSSVTTVGANVKVNAGTINTASSTIVDFGGFEMISVTANSATSVNFGQTESAGLVVNAAKATSITGNSLKTVTADLNINAPKATVIGFNALTSTGSLTISAANSNTVVNFDKLTVAKIRADASEVKEFHFPAYVTTTDVIHIKALTIAATKLKTIATGDVVWLHTANLSAPALAAVVGTLNLRGSSLANADVNLPLAKVSGTLTSVATSVTIASTTDATLANVLSATNTHLSLGAQQVAVEGVAAGLSDTALLSLTITGAAATADAASYPIFTQDVTKLAVLKYLNVGNLSVVTIPTASVIGTMTTTGMITDLSIVDAEALSSLTVGHGPHTYEDAPAQGVTITDTELLASVDLSTVTKLDTAAITTNAKLATITAPALGSALLANGVVSISISANLLTATATVAEPGTALAEVKQPSLTGWKAYIGQCVAAGIATVGSEVGLSAYVSGGGSIAHSIDFDKVYNVGGTLVDGDFNDTFTASGTISVPTDLAIIDSND